MDNKLYVKQNNESREVYEQRKRDRLKRKCLGHVKKGVSLDDTSIYEDGVCTRCGGLQRNIVKFGKMYAEDLSTDEDYIFKIL